MDMLKPSENHLTLKRLQGSWIGDERLHPSPSDPTGGNGVGRVINRLALNGLIVIQDYEQERDGKVSSKGHGIFSWDGTLHSYAFHWFDSLGTTPSVFHGGFQDNALTLISKEKHGLSRVIFHFPDDGVYHFHFDVSKDGSHWYTMKEGRYIRQ
jgi:hypothetical protein